MPTQSSYTAKHQPDRPCTNTCSSLTLMGFAQQGPAIALDKLNMINGTDAREVLIAVGRQLLKSIFNLKFCTGPYEAAMLLRHNLAMV